MPIDGTVIGNVFGGGGVLQRKTFKHHFLHFFFPLSPSLFLSPSLSASLSLSPSPLLFHISLPLFLFPFLVDFSLTGCWPM